MTQVFEEFPTLVSGPVDAEGMVSVTLPVPIVTNTGTERLAVGVRATHIPAVANVGLDKAPRPYYYSNEHSILPDDEKEMYRWIYHLQVKTRPGKKETLSTIYTPYNEIPFGRFNHPIDLIHYMINAAPQYTRDYTAFPTTDERYPNLMDEDGDYPALPPATVFMSDVVHVAHNAHFATLYSHRDNGYNFFGEEMGSEWYVSICLQVTKKVAGYMGTDKTLHWIENRPTFFFANSTLETFDKYTLCMHGLPDSVMESAVRPVLTTVSGWGETTKNPYVYYRVLKDLHQSGSGTYTDQILMWVEDRKRRKRQLVYPNCGQQTSNSRRARINVDLTWMRLATGGKTPKARASVMDYRA